MKLIQDNIWNHYEKRYNNFLFFTANSIVKHDGCLVMGAGFARQVRDKHRLVDEALGDKIKGRKHYGIAFARPWYPHIGAFQTKYSYKDPSPLSLIGYSTTKLLSWLSEYENRNITVHMNFPGIGLGGLEYEQVFPILQVLPDRVTLYRQ